MDDSHLNTIVDVLTEEDYGSYFGTYISQVPRGMTLAEALDVKSSLLADTLAGISESKALHRYAPDKWSIKEVIMHLIDSERIFTYRALRYARMDTTNLMGFDQDHFVMTAGADELPLTQLLDTHLLQRRNTQAMFRCFNADMLAASGMTSDYKMSVKALGFFFLAHELHHVNIIKERYL